MKNSQAKRLSEELLNVDQKIVADAFEIDDAKKLKQYTKLKTNEAKKPFYITATFKRATAIAACLAIVAVTAFTLTNKTNNITPNNDTSSNTDVSSNNNSGTSIENKKVIYVIGDAPDEEIVDGDSIKSLNQKYISQKLQEKMNLYKDHTDAEVRYCVVIDIFVAQEDYNKASELANTNTEVQSLLKQLEKALAEERKAESELSVFNGLNKGNDPETVEKRKELIAIRDEKEKNKKDIWRQYANLNYEIADEYCDKVLEERLVFLKQFSEQELETASYNGYTLYIMDLTAKEINILAEKGGYSFRLSNEKPPIAESA